MEAVRQAGGEALSVSAAFLYLTSHVFGSLLTKETNVNEPEIRSSDTVAHNDDVSSAQRNSQPVPRYEDLDDVGERLRTQLAEHEVHDVEHWTKQAEEGVARARLLGTPEAWREVARIAEVVSDVTEATQAFFAAKKRAEQALEAGNEAVEISKAAAATAMMKMQLARTAVDLSEEIAGVVKTAQRANAAAGWREAAQNALALEEKRVHDSLFRDNVPRHLS
jgi:hypothetical protein